MWTLAALAASAALAPTPAGAVSLSMGLGQGSLSAAEAVLGRGRDAARRFLRQASEGLVEPLHFDQKLLVCNAYPGPSPVTVLKNGQDMLNDGKDAISFQECRYVDGNVQKQDRLDFGLRDVEVHGTFEVGDLPNSDAVLLLVLEKREGSPMLSFQSFAFPSASGRKDAQLAVINTFKGNSTAPRLKMEDHEEAHAGADKQKLTVAKRVEQLNFNRVYSIEEGNYDASIADEGRKAGSEEEELEKKTMRSLKLAKATNYVMLRTDAGAGAESLVVFPETPIEHSGGRQLAASSLVLVLMALLAASFAA